MTKPRKPSKPAGRAAVYRLFNADGVLLYIGCSYDPVLRCKVHAKHKRWWGEVAHRADEWHETRANADAIEKRAIEMEKPKYNVCFTPLQAKVCHRAAPLTAEEAAVWMRTWDTRESGTYASTPGSCGYRAVQFANPGRG